MNGSANAHVQADNRIVGWVWYNGADAIRKGEAVCYDIANGDATAYQGRRHNQVVRPTTATAKAFAGVCERDYSAQTSGQFIEINLPGSKGVAVALGVDTAINTGVLTFAAGTGTEAGRFYTGKYLGSGSAIPRQTVTAVIESGMTGTWELATDGVTLTVASTAGLVAGDTVVLVAGEMETATEYVVPGKYVISSITDATTIVLAATAVSATPAAAVTCTGYAYTGNPTCQADLLVGNESGGVEFISILNAGNANLPHMVGGVSYLTATDIAAAGTIVLAQGTLPGETKAVVCLGAVATSDYEVDPATDGIQTDGSTALAVVNAINDAGDAWYGVFGGGLWHTGFFVVGGLVYYF